MNINDLEKAIEDNDAFPTLPNIVIKAFQIINDPDSSAQNLNDIINKDQVIMSKILRLVNSAYYGLGRKVVDIKDSVTILGFGTISNLLLSISLFDSFRKTSFDLDKFWMHTITAATASEYFAKKACYPKPDIAYVTSLIHDIGKLVFVLCFPKEYKQILESMETEELQFIQAERKLFTVDHTTAGKLLCEKWNLPSIYTETVSCHHTPLSCNAEADIVYYVYLSNLMAHKFDDNKAYEHETNFALKRLKEFNLTSQDWDDCLEYLNQKKDTMKDFLTLIKK